MRTATLVGEALATELTAEQISQVSGGECENPYISRWWCEVLEDGTVICYMETDCEDDF